MSVFNGVIVAVASATAVASAVTIANVEDNGTGAELHWGIELPGGHEIKLHKSVMSILN